MAYQSWTIKIPEFYASRYAASVTNQIVAFGWSFEHNQSPLDDFDIQADG